MSDDPEVHVASDARSEQEHAEREKLRRGIFPWLVVKRGEHFTVRESAEGAFRRRECVALADSTETSFGHAHVEVRFLDDKDPATTTIRTNDLDPGEFESETVANVRPDPQAVDRMDNAWKGPSNSGIAQLKNDKDPYR